MLKIELPFNSESSLLGIYSEKMKLQRYIYIFIYSIYSIHIYYLMSVLYTKAEIEKQILYLPMHKWMKNVICV
jgi:hypothetical protein